MEILIVEDDFISRSLLKKMLSEMGHTVVESENGDQAWRIVQDRPINFVISDWIMPGMDGLDLCRNIRSQSSHEYVYIIILTVRDRADDLVEVFEAGADDYIAKPFDPKEFRARVNRGVRVTGLEENRDCKVNILKESRDKLLDIVDNLEDEMVSINRDFHLVAVNKAFADYMNFSPRDLVGRSVLDNGIFDGSYLADPGIIDLISNVFEFGGTLKKQYRCLDAGNDEKYRQISCLPIRSEKGGISQIVILSRNITEEQQQTEQIKRLNELLTGKNAELENALNKLGDTQAQMLQSGKLAAIGQLAAGVAHEINNPTGFVKSNLKALSDYHKDLFRLIESYQQLADSINPDETGTDVSGTIKEKLESIQTVVAEIDPAFLMEDIIDLIDDCRIGTERIKKIANDLRTFAHPGEDKLQMMDINDGLDATLNVVNNEIKYKAMVRRDFGSIPAIKGYPQQLNQVFMNILVNAAQAMDTKGEITIQTRKSRKHVEVVISDTGCGIPQENIEKIFDPFFTTKEVGKGTGLGMNIAYNIIRKHNGTIDVTSQVGQGTTFTIKLPVEPETGVAV